MFAIHILSAQRRTHTRACKRIHFTMPFINMIIEWRMCSIMFAFKTSKDETILWTISLRYECGCMLGWTLCCICFNVNVLFSNWIASESEEETYYLCKFSSFFGFVYIYYETICLVWRFELIISYYKWAVWHQQLLLCEFYKKKFICVICIWLINSRPL